MTSWMMNFATRFSRTEKVDLIVDGGTRSPGQIIVQFFRFFKTMLKPGGIYSIEGIETNYWNTDHSELNGKTKAGKEERK